MDSLTADELVQLIRRVFRPGPDDRALAILIDLPDAVLPDRKGWRTRRSLAAGWARELAAAGGALGIEVGLFGYRNVRANNAELPDIAWRVDPDHLPGTADELDERRSVPFEEVLATHRLVMAPTELSTTAPLKRLAPRLGFRAATMPGFTTAMVPALRLDYHEVDRRVRLLKGLLDRAEAAELVFMVDGAERADLHLDLRHRMAHASSGLLHEPGTAGNLPSGEAYIVPYEGEQPGDPSRSAGVLPIQLGDEVVSFRIEANQAIAVDSEGPASDAARRLLATEPATGNLAELGLGVLADLGVKPIGQVLLDEKLGLHLAFGRSDHFGGAVGPGDFSRPEAVIHQDHVFLPELQPRVVPARVELVMPDASRLELMRDGHYTVRFNEGS